MKPCKSGANRVAPEAGRHGKKHLEASMVGECGPSVSMFKKVRAVRAVNRGHEVCSGSKAYF